MGLMFGLFMFIMALTLMKKGTGISMIRKLLQVKLPHGLQQRAMRVRTKLKIPNGLFPRHH